VRVSLLLVAAAVPLLDCGKLKERIQLLRAPPPPVVAAAPVAPPPAPAPPPPPADPYQHVDVVLHGPLEKELSAKVAPGTAPALALVMQRLSLWWMSPGEERNGDEIRAVYELPAGHEPLVRALRYTSLKYGKTFTAYYYQPAGAPFGRYFTEDGTELEERLKDAPVANYEQVTSFLKDGRHHKGVDFKCPVGTPVVMPFDGTLVKKNWNWRGNGNCLEFTDDHTGHHAKFLHLSVLPDTLKPGQHFKLGQQVALSGNTGHTTAPHLHYQLESSSGAILDPFKVHPTYRTKLPDADLDGFKKVAADLDASLAR